MTNAFPRSTTRKILALDEARFEQLERDGELRRFDVRGSAYYHEDDVRRLAGRELAGFALKRVDETAQSS